jgi:hypothetical protein
VGIPRSIQAASLVPVTSLRQPRKGASTPCQERTHGTDNRSCDITAIPGAAPDPRFAAWLGAQFLGTGTLPVGHSPICQGLANVTVHRGRRFFEVRLRSRPKCSLKAGSENLVVRFIPVPGLRQMLLQFQFRVPAPLAHGSQLPGCRASGLWEDVPVPRFARRGVCFSRADFGGWEAQGEVHAATDVRPVSASSACWSGHNELPGRCLISFPQRTGWV